MARKQSPRFPLSRMTPNMVKNWDSGRDPLDFLYPHEITAAELWCSMRLDPSATKNWAGTPDKRAFATRFREHFGFDFDSHVRKGLMTNPAWNAYVRSLMTQTRDAVMKRLESQAFRAADNYLWAQEEARATGDYKETRVASGDHLDRIGATQKPEIAQKAVVVILQSRNFDQRDLHKALPAVETAEIVVEDDAS